ncbi:unnamed protein product [Moneuplotes crassus]|uniref:Uncharacterized protein n=1 Tax=Euplotes crassus TaxID=5936 RepID=A0AAD1XW64_EUPCR|nr:unnamed protein product [Moneuplotes crassus]
MFSKNTKQCNIYQDFSSEVFRGGLGTLHPDNVFTAVLRSCTTKSNVEFELDWSCFGYCQNYLIYPHETIQNTDSVDSNLTCMQQGDSQGTFKATGRNIIPEIPAPQQNSRRIPKPKSSSPGMGSSGQCSLRPHKRRKDIEYKFILRLLRKFYKNLFKQDHSRIVARRFINCRIHEVLPKVRATLQGRISEALITDRLITFTIGMIGLKKPTDLDCSDSLKSEVANFLECLRSFSHDKIQKALHSTSLRVLCEYFLDNCDCPQTSYLREDLSQAGD